ncbi:hypothetical protein EW146_g1749 [Bondarzewia mesenterica]|uniref:FAD-binding PCMH-type domain-containing protein n=1 Tax=Bondarzewia mesenterica TaxID=1095465 RepID=A0A4S4M2W6_9AGAM|nr:hypothetical protein EW146_g1749 [Bondarzewia mesenterica]
MSLTFSSFVVVSGLVIAAILTSNVFKLSKPLDSRTIVPGMYTNDFDAINAACQVIAQAISIESDVHWPGSSEFDVDIHHWASSSTERSRCSVRPANTSDLAIILELTLTKMVKITGGGHALNPGFSSTTGIHIAMSRFIDLKHNEDARTVDIGAGLRWDDVYGLLNPNGYSVGGTVIVPESGIERANNIIAGFAANIRDPKATVNIIYEFAEGSLNAIIVVFYNAPEPPAGLFDEVLSIQNGVVHVSSFPFLDLLSAGQPRNTPRRIQDEVPVQKWTPYILNKVANETKFWGSYLEKHYSGHFFDYVVEIFLPDYFSHGSASAWPADRSVVHYPINVAFAWFDQKYDTAVHEALRRSVAKLRADIMTQGQSIDDATLYPNLPIFGTPVEQMYGKNLERLREIRAVYDPQGIMGLTGGWHF